MRPAPEEDVMDHLHALMHLFKSSMRQALAGSQDGVGPMEARALGFFARHPGSTQSELVEHSGRDKAQIARLIKLLLERGLLEGTPDERDRRATRLSMTEAGRTLQRSLQQHRKRLATRLTTGLSAEEHAQLLQLLQRLRANVEPPSDEAG
jgi:DNA-binding MarR family transcriptional regulator